MYSDTFLEEETTDNIYPYEATENRTMIVLCGTHGVGKTTISDLLATDYEQQLATYYLKEMQRRFKDKDGNLIKAGTPEFQLRYKREMSMRNGAIAGLLEYGDGIVPDVLIVDRLPTDVDIYSNYTQRHSKGIVNYIAHEMIGEISKWASFYEERGYDSNVQLSVIVVLINRDIDKVMDSLVDRMEQDTARKGWDETNKRKWIELNETFIEVFRKATVMIQSMQTQGFLENVHITTVSNDGDPMDAKESIIRIVEMMTL